MGDTAHAEGRPAPLAPLALGRVVIIGGGCYGSYYLQQLRRARERGAAAITEIIVVDRDPHCRVAVAGGTDHRFVCDTWDPWLAMHLAQPATATDAIVPSPLMPHLLLHWLRDRARAMAGSRSVEIEAPSPVEGVPWQREGTDGSRYVSFAEWMCPVNCIEPRICPHTRGVRDWSMPTAVAGMPGMDGFAVLHCTHRTFGVGMIDTGEIQRAERTVTELVARGTPVRLLVGTVSHCHGALGVLRID